MAKDEMTPAQLRDIMNFSAEFDARVQDEHKPYTPEERLAMILEGCKPDDEKRTGRAFYEDFPGEFELTNWFVEAGIRG